jgi:1-aminocyclopropane-1-carboxylate deaminase/D-cysteine desulfhydrase-like pyridoxal-dependent ACC family enzyme
VSVQPPALFRRFPKLERVMPWLPLGEFPTPIEPLPLLETPTDARVWVKRDDLSSQVYGGNKVRKLEFILAAAKEKRATRLITVGAAGSHHALATAIYGRRLGFEVTLVLFPQEVTPHVREVLRMNVAEGADIRYAPRMEMIPLAKWLTQLGYRDQRTFVIAAGGSDVSGTLGYVSAGLELAEQVEQGIAPLPDVVHLSAGTLGTVAGLSIGLAVAGLPTRVAGARIVSKLVAGEHALTRLLRATLRKLARGGVPVPTFAQVRQRLTIMHGYVGTGYGRETEQGAQASERFAKLGLKLDPTYTSKAAAELTEAIENGAPGNHLFWHTLSATPVPELPDTLEERLPEPFQRMLAGSE